MLLINCCSIKWTGIETKNGPTCYQLRFRTLPPRVQGKPLPELRVTTLSCRPLNLKIWYKQTATTSTKPAWVEDSNLNQVIPMKSSKTWFDDVSCLVATMEPAGKLASWVSSSCWRYLWRNPDESRCKLQSWLLIPQNPKFLYWKFKPRSHLNQGKAIRAPGHLTCPFQISLSGDIQS